MIIPSKKLKRPETARDCRTIGDVERLAGIGQTLEERRTFWMKFAHLGDGAYDAARAELYRMIETREKLDKIALANEITIDQLKTLIDFAAKQGRTWKTKLRDQWLSASAAPLLHSLRNSHGPSWLASFQLPKL